MNLVDYAVAYHQASDGTPAYQRIKNIILTGIKEGTLTPGTPVPSENELVEVLGVSRMTINRAMRELTNDGILNRARGIGTFIAEPKARGALFEVRNIAEEIQERGYTYSSQVVVLEEVPADAAPEGFGGTAFRSLILHFEDGKPLQLEERYVNPRLAPHYLEQDFSVITPNQYLTEVAPLVGGKHSAEAVLPSKREAELLKIDPSEPCLLLRRSTYSQDGSVSVARLLHPGSRMRLESDF